MGTGILTEPKMCSISEVVRRYWVFTGRITQNLPGIPEVIYLQGVLWTLRFQIHFFMTLDIKKCVKA